MVVQDQCDGVWEIVTDREQAETAIMANNYVRFHLTITTPLMSQYMRERLRCLAHGELAGAILNGSFVPDPNLDEYTNAFLFFVSSRSHLPLLSATVSMLDF